MTIGLDTSVVLRLLIGLPEDQANVARRRLAEALDSDERVVLTDLALAEAYYALQHHYEVPKDQARRRLADLARSGLVTVEPPEAVASLGHDSGAGLVDRLIHARHRATGATTWTFERRMSKLDGAVRLG